MKRVPVVWLYIILFFSVAVITGRIAVLENQYRDTTASRAFNAGAGQLGEVIADFLWLDMDRYHHIWMYQGHDWKTATDYLPQLWLVTKLNPDFPDAYVDGSYHLAVNLGNFQEGIRLLDRGMRNCPDNEKIYWEKLQILWQTGNGSPRQVRLAAWDYLDLVRRKSGDIAEPWNEANAYMITGFTFRDDSTRRNSPVLSRRYDQRADFLRSAGSAGYFGDQDEGGLHDEE